MGDKIKELTGFIIDAKFSSHEEMAEMAKLWDTELIQLEDGDFKGFMSGIHTPHIQIVQSHQSHGLIVKGKIPPNAYLFANITASGEVTTGGIPLTSGDIMVLDDRHDLNFTSKSAFSDVTIVVDKTFFKDIYKKFYGIPFSYNKDVRIIKIDQSKKSNLKDDVAKWIKYLINNKEDWIHDLALTELIEKNIIGTLFSYFAVYEKSKLLSSEKDAIALQAYIHNYYATDLTIKEICDTLKISERGVRPSFKKLFGYNPKEYLSRYRLGKFRNALVNNDNESIFISDICYEQGIFHPGRLPRDYKKMFGYLPSDMVSKEEDDN